MCLAYPMRVEEIKDTRAIVSAEGIKKEINIEFLKDVKIGDYVMVHAGFAIEKFDSKEAKKTIEYFKEYKDALRKTSKR
ncbi:MAG: HypC/HybG/HupF family hydrogenase formation chaperone [Candidatus Omnitrophota bacterium]|nr:HypC/HybG/HupF family hydrogenase formation chaperone [Candidatus Omnitrophota bacterium]